MRSFALCLGLLVVTCRGVVPSTILRTECDRGVESIVLSLGDRLEVSVQEPLEVRIARDVEQALEAWNGEVLELERKIGTAPHLFPFLVPHLDSASRARAASALLARMRGLSAGEVAQGLRGLRSLDPGLLNALAATFASFPDSSAAVKPLEAAEGTGARALNILIRSAQGEDVEGSLKKGLLDSDRGFASFCLSRVTALGPTGLSILRSVIEGLPSSESQRDLELRTAALEVASREESLGLLKEALADERFLAVLDRASLSQEVRARLVAECLAAPSNPARLQRLLSVGQDVEERELHRRVFAEPGMTERLALAAREPCDASDPLRRELASLLPINGLLLSHRDTVLALATKARPAHAVFLSENLDYVEWPARTQVALALNRLGHPSGIPALQVGLQNREPKVIAGILDLLSEHSFRISESEMRDLLLRPEAREATLSYVDQMQVLLPSDDCLAALTWATDDEARAALRALDRGADANFTVARNLAGELLASPERFADVDVLSEWILGPRFPFAADLIRPALQSADAALRSQALLALGRESGDRIAAGLRDLERLSRDPSPRVRTCVAPLLGKCKSDLARTALVLLTRDEVALVRRAAVLALGGQDPYHVIPVLRQATRDEDPWTRNAARISLIRQGFPEEAQALLEDIDQPGIDARTRKTLDAQFSLASSPERTRAEYGEAIKSAGRGIK